MYFYEFYFKKTNGELVDVPVIVENYVDSGQNRVNSSLNDKTSLKLNRRIFLYDNLSGVEGTINPLNRTENSLKYFQYADKILLEFTISKTLNAILKPYIYIRYNTIRINDEQKEEIRKFNFKIYYENNNSIFNTTMIVLFAISNVLLFFISIFKCVNWKKYHPSTNFSDEEYIKNALNYIMIFITTWSFGMFFFLFFYIGIIFFLFKFQSVAYFFIPDYENHFVQYRGFNGTFWVIFGFMIINLFNFFYKLNNRKIILIDFEKQQLDNEKRSLSIWRSILITNEFKELSVYRLIKIEFVFIIFWVLIEGFGFKYLTSENTFLFLSFKNIQSNYVLEYFLHSFLILFIALVYLFFRKLLKFKIPYKIDEFLDLCSISNISIFIFSSSSHGFYIHGNNPLGTSEGTIEDFRLNLKKESKGFGKKRGLILNDNSNLQTFEILIPFKIKKIYEILFVKPTEDEIRDKLNNNKIAYNNPSIPNDLNINKLEKGINNLILFLKIEIENILSKGKENLLQRSFVQNLFNLLPISFNLIKENIFLIKDETQKITENMILGNELFLLIIYFNFYFGMIYAIRNSTISLFITYIFHLIVDIIINRIITRNISRNTLIKEEFLN